MHTNAEMKTAITLLLACNI